MLVQQVADTFGVQSELVHEECDGTCVDVTAPGTHDETFERGQSHGRVYALPVLYGRYACAVAYVARDDALAVGLYAKELAHALADVAVAGAMETIAAHAILDVQLMWQGIHIGIVGHGLVKRRVEYAHLWYLGQQGLHGLHTLDVGWVVEWGKVVACGESLHHLGGEHYALVELLSSVYHAVAYCIQFLEVAQYCIVTCGQHLEYPLHSCRVLLYGTLHAVLLAI